MRLGPEGEPSSCPPSPEVLEASSHRLARRGVWQRSDSGDMVDKTDGTGRRGRPPPGGRGCRAQFQRPPGHGTRL